MLKLPNRGRYALVALMDIALFGAVRPAQTRDIAERQRIPLRFLEQIFQDLKRAGLVLGKRGPGGGFTLARPAADVRVGDVLRATCGPISIAPVPMLAAAANAGRTGKRSDLRRVMDAALTDVGHRVEECFDAVTLADLSKRGEALGVARPEPRARYAI